LPTKEIGRNLRNYLSIRSREAVQAFLNHMIAVQILDELDNLVAQGMDDDFDLEL
jgi:hypothetical protein